MLYQFDHRREDNALGDNEVALHIWKMLHYLAHGILVCKHIDKMLFKRPSVMMSGGPSLIMSGRLSMMISEHLSMMISRGPSLSGRLSVMISERPSMMITEGPSLMMFGCPSKMIYGRPSIMMSGRLSVMMSKRPSMMMSGHLSMVMSGCLSVMMSKCLSIRLPGRPSMMRSGCPLIRISGQPSVSTSGRPSMRMSGRPSMRMSGRSTLRMSGGPAMRISESPSLKMFGCPSIRMAGQPSVRMSGRPSMRMSGRSITRMSGRPSMMMSGRPSIPSMRMSGHPSISMSGRPSMRMSGHSIIRMSRRPSMKMSGQPSVRISGRLSMRMSGRQSMKMSGGPSIRMSERLLMRMSGRSSIKVSGRPSTKMSGRPSVRMSGRLSMRISQRLSMKVSGRLLMKMSVHNNEEFQEENPDGNLEYGTRCKQDIAEDSCCEKHDKEDFHAIKVNETTPPKKYTGLENQAATCYLNTVLQILFMTEDFRKAVERWDFVIVIVVISADKTNSDITCVFYRYVINNSRINYHIAQLFEHLQSGERNIATTKGITAELKINVHKQEDAAKCLQKILNMLDPEMSKVFQGTKVDTTVCKKPAKHHEPLNQYKTFFILSISLESQDHVNLQSCFDSYFQPIIMHGEDQQIYCNDCQMKMDTEMSCSLQKVPLVLVLHLERFELDYDTMCCVKNDSSVQIPAQLLVKEKAGVNHMSHKYDLYAIANHVGSLNSGHYYADIKSFEDQRWYQFNDSSVHLVNQKYDLDKCLSSDEAYLLFYKKSGSAASETTCYSQEIVANENTMEERLSCECEDAEKEETNTNNIQDSKSQPNFNLAEQQTDFSNTSDGCLDVSESTSAKAGSAASETTCYSQEIVANENTMEERLYCECEDPEKEETNTNIQDSKLQPNFNLAEQPADISNTSDRCLDVPESTSAKAGSAAPETTCYSQEIVANENTMEERLYCECEDPEKEETNTNIQDSKLQPNFNLAEQQEDFSNTSDRCLDVPESTSVSAASEATCYTRIVDNQNTIEERLSCEWEYLLGHRCKHPASTNASTQKMMSGEECKIAMDTVSNDSESDNKISIFQNVYNVNIRFLILLLLCTCLLFFIWMQVGINTLL